MKEKRLSSQTNEPGREWQRTGIESRKVEEGAWYLGNKICTCIFKSADGFCSKSIYLAVGQIAQNPPLLNNAKPQGIFPIANKLET